MKKIIVAVLMVLVLSGVGSAWGFDMAGWWIFKTYPHQLWSKDDEGILIETVAVKLRMYCEQTYEDKGEAVYQCGLFDMSGEPEDGYAEIYILWDEDQMIFAFFMDIGPYTFSLPKKVWLPTSRIQGQGITWTFARGVGFGRGTYIIRRP